MSEGATGIKFFGEVDRTGKGRITSAYPAWYFDVHINDMAEEIRKKQRALERGEIAPAKRAETISNIEKESTRLKEIQDSRPKITAAEKDKLSKVRGEIGEQIRESMFNRSSMMSGQASAHEEAKRMVNPIIKVDPEVAKACGVQTDGRGMVSRNGATKMYQIVSRFIGEESNAEHLRRE